jgi:hypothetical protein
MQDLNQHCGFAGRMFLGIIVLASSLSWSYPGYAQAIVTERTAVEEHSAPVETAPAPPIVWKSAAPIAAQRAVSPAAGGTSGSTISPAAPSTNLTWGSPASALTAKPVVKTRNGVPPLRAIAKNSNVKTQYLQGGIVPGGDGRYCGPGVGVPCSCPANKPAVPQPAGCDPTVVGAQSYCGNIMPPLPCYCVLGASAEAKSILDPRGCTVPPADTYIGTSGDNSN